MFGLAALPLADVGLAVSDDWLQPVVKNDVEIAKTPKAILPRRCFKIPPRARTDLPDPDVSTLAEFFFTAIVDWTHVIG